MLHKQLKRCAKGKVRFIALLFSLLFLSAGLYAQKSSFGLNVGTYFPWTKGVNQVGDVVIIAESDQGNGERIFGIFYAYKVANFVTVKTELNYFPSIASFIVYDEAEECVFCPVAKASSISKNTVGFFPAVKYAIPFFRNSVSINLIAGASIHFQFRTAMSDIHFNGRHPQVADVINALDETPKSAVLYFNYGLSLDYRRFSLTGRFQDSPGNSFVNDIVIDGQKFPFRVKNRYLHLTLSYSFYGLRRK